MVSSPLKRLCLLLGLLVLAALRLPTAGAAAAADTGEKSGGVSGRPALVDGDMSSRVRACTTCHGLEGRSTPSGYYPRIAGKPAGYLYQQLLNFRDGRRSYPQMAYLLEHLPDAYLQEIAAHFSQLHVPYAPPPALPVPRQVLEAGRRLALQGDAGKGVPACVRCHGDALMGLAPSVPGLLGLPRDYLNSQLGAWATGQRRARTPDCMARIARALSPDDVAAVSAWLASQPVPAGARPATGAASLAQPLPMPCGGVDLPAREATR